MSEQPNTEEPSEAAVIAGLYNRGRVTWHSSEEDGGPDVGLSLGLGDGRMLWLGEAPNSALIDAGLKPRPGWYFIIYDQSRALIFAQATGDAEEAREAFNLVAGALAAPSDPPSGQGEEVRALVAEVRPIIAPFVGMGRLTPDTDKRDGKVVMRLWDGTGIAELTKADFVSICRLADKLDALFPRTPTEGGV